ncbi:MAG: helicase [Chloroflexi bacterium]|nr:helicase [Chloroflexota bacterium]MCY4248737.1 helicase [Chloroflexota bacterium]
MPEEASAKQGKLYYFRLPDDLSKEDKLAFLASAKLSDIDWQRLVPNSKHTWLRSDTEDEFAACLPIGSKDAKKASAVNPEVIFKTYSGGVKTNRDPYCYDYRMDDLAGRMRQFIENYNSEIDKYRRQQPSPNVDEFVDYEKLKWSSTLKNNLRREKYTQFDSEKVIFSQYRPFCRKYLYFDQVLNDRVLLQHKFFPNIQLKLANQAICVNAIGNSQPFHTVMVDTLPDFHLTGDTQTFPFYTYAADGSNRTENITDWALAHFRDHYADPSISKWDIFYYVYGLLHHPGYRSRYALDLKRSLPRIPLAPSPKMREGELGDSEHAFGDESPLPLYGGGGLGVGVDSGFYAFSRAGRQLADLHLHYESADRYELDWQATRTPVSYRVEKMLPKGKVAAADASYKVYGALKYNDTLTLRGIPERAFAYRLGNRSALDWIVDQYRVKTDKRSGIAHDPNGYSDDPQYILKLIERVITVSVRTVAIVERLAARRFR